jgi:hypothetical protein
MPFFTEKLEKDSYSMLEESNRKITEACYAAYREESKGKIWRKVNEQEIAICNDQNQPILMDESVASMYTTGKTHSVNAWISFALSMAKESVEPTESITKKAFEEVYKPAAGYTTYSGENRIPNFDELLDRQKAAWLAAAKAAFHEKEPEPRLSNLQSKP